jgi:hypothetical protein
VFAPLLACSEGGVRVPAAEVADSAAPGDSAEAVVGQGEVDPTDAVFDVETIHEISLEMSEADWSDIRDNPWAESWHTATFTCGGEVVADVGIRAFGAGSEIAGKPSLKISFDHVVAGRDWRGLEQLKLDNSSQDYGFLNERIGTAMLRRQGLPASRTGWANVTVNGSFAGFFVLLEAVDDVFLRRWFGDDAGILYGTADGHHGQGLNPFANGAPLDWYSPQTSTPTDGSDLLVITDLVANGSDDALNAALDVEEFTRLSVTRSVFGGIDAFSADGNNFYLYDLDGFWTVIAWDLDADLGYPYYFSTALTVDPRSPWSSSPWAYNPVSYAAYTDPVLTRAMAMGWDPDALALEVVQGVGEWNALDAEVKEAAALIEDAVWADVLGYGPYFDQRKSDLRLWLHARLSGLAGEEVADCALPEPGVVNVTDLSPTGSVGWGELTLDETAWGPGFNIAGEHFCTGFFAHAPSDVVVTVPEGYTTLTAWVGLQDWNQQCGDGATFRVEQGGEVLWDSATVVNYGDAVPTSTVDVAAGELHFIADPNAEYSCDVAVWADVELR